MSAKTVIFLATLLGLATSATTAYGARVIKYNIHDQGPFIVLAYTDQPLILSFPAEVELAYGQTPKAKSPVVPLFHKHSHEVKLTPRKGIGPGTVPMTVVTAKQTVRFAVELVNRASYEAYDRAEFYDGHAIERLAAQRSKVNFRRRMALLLLRGVKTTAIDHTALEGGDKLAVRNPSLVRVGHMTFFIFELINRSLPILRLQTIRAFDEARESEHTSFIQVDVSEGIHASDHLAELVKGQRVRVLVEVDSLDHLGSAALFDFVTASGVVLATERLSFFPPDPPPSVGRLSLQASAAGGTVSLASPVPGSEQSEFALMWGFGARAGYGIHRNFSLEGSVSVVYTDDAKFPDNAETRATMVRFMGNAVLHTGETTVRYARVGIGGRISDYQMTAAGSAASEQRTSGLFNIGVGVDAWLGNNVVLGLSAQIVSPMGGGDGLSFELGASAGIAWKLAREDE